MRTTLTLDPDVAARLKAEGRRSGESFKEVVNNALRRGLALTDIKTGAEAPFRIRAHRSGGLQPPFASADNVGDVLAALEELERGSASR